MQPSGKQTDGANEPALIPADRINFAEVARRLAELEGRVGQHDEAMQLVFTTLRQLIEPLGPETDPPQREIGFHVRETAPPYRLRRNLAHA